MFKHFLILKSHETDPWKLLKQSNNSEIINLFHGLFKNTYKCEHCGNDASTYDTFSFITLPKISANNRKLGSLLLEISNEEILDEWFCEKCKCDTKTTLKVTFNKLPKVLLIRMKTSDYDERVEFDLNLKLKGDSEKKSFNLICVSNHYGSFHGGHCKSLVSKNN